MATTTGFKVQCPSCEALVTIKNASLIGKKIDCPKCKYRFVVEAPADLDAETAAVLKGKKQGGGTAVARKKAAKAAADEDDEDDEDDGPSKKKKQKSPVILIVGIVLIVLTIGLVGAYFGGLFGGDDEKTDSGTQGTNTPTKTNGPAPGGTTTPGGTASEAGNHNSTGPAVAIAGTPPLSRSNEITNLLPNDAQWVLDVPDVHHLLETPAGTRVFDPSKQTNTLLKNHFGMTVDQIARVVASGGGDGAWTFTVVRAKGSLNVDAMKGAMELGDPAGTIKRRDYYVAKENPVFRAIGEYFKTKLEEIKFKLDPPSAPRQMTVCFLDSKTLAVADRPVMEKFLDAGDAGAEPEYLSRLATGGAPPAAGQTGGMPGGPRPPGSVTGPSGGGTTGPSPPGARGMRNDSVAPADTPRVMSAPRPPGSVPGPSGGGPPPGLPGAPGAGQPAQPRLFTSIPSFRTVKPELKAMLNGMEGMEAQKPLFNFAGRVQTSRILELFLGTGIDVGGGKFKPSLPPGTKTDEAIPKAPFIGIALYELNTGKFDLRIAVDCDDEDQAKGVESLVRIFLPIIAAVIEDEVGLPVHAPGSSNGFPEGGPGGVPGMPGGYPPGMAPPGGMPPGVGPPGPGRPGGMSAPFSAPRPPGPGQPPGGPGGPPPGRPPGGPGGRPPGLPPGGPGGRPPGLPPGGSPPGGSPGGYPGYPDQNQQKPAGTVSLTRTDKLLVLRIEIDWKEQYVNKIKPPLDDYFDGVAGQAMLLAAAQPWQKLSQAVKQLAATGEFPQATHKRPSLAARMGLPFAPEQRVSWMVELLPALGYRQLYDQIEKDQAWNNPRNLRAGRAWIPEFLDPNQDPDSWRASLNSVVGRDLGATGFVGLAGIGLDAAELPDTPENAKRLGVFGYERRTKVADIKDGLDKTIFMIQVEPNIARPWIRGGGATVQSVPETNSFRPFRVRQPDLSYGAYAIMCDGSIRFIKTGVPDALFKAMVTYKAGDDTTGIDEWAPKRELTNRLHTDNQGGAGSSGGAAQYVPKDWTPLSLRIRKAGFGVAMPPGKIESVIDRPEEKEFTGTWPGKNLTLGAHAVYRPGLATSDPTGVEAGKEVQRYLELQGLTQDGSVVDAPALGTSKGKQFRAKPTPDFKGTAIYRLWVANEARLVISVVGPADLKDADAEEYFKTVVATGHGITETPKFAKWQYWYSSKLRFAVRFPGEPQVLPGDNIYLFYPKIVDGGALFTMALKSAALDPTIDANKAYKAMEKATKDKQFGDNPTNLRKKFLGDRAGVMFDDMRGDIPYTVWAVYLNEEAAVVLAVRKNAGLTATDEKTFFDSLLIGITKPPEDGPAPGASSPPRPGAPPGPGLPPGSLRPKDRPGPPGK